MPPMKRAVRTSTAGSPPRTLVHGHRAVFLQEHPCTGTCTGTVQTGKRQHARTRPGDSPLQHWQHIFVRRMCGVMDKEPVKLVRDGPVLAPRLKRDDTHKDGFLYKKEADRTSDDSALLEWAIDYNIKKGYIRTMEGRGATGYRQSPRTAIPPAVPLWSGVFPPVVVHALSETRDSMAALCSQRETHVANIVAKEQAELDRKPKAFVRKLEVDCKSSERAMQHIATLLPKHLRNRLAHLDQRAGKVASIYFLGSLRWDPMSCIVVGTEYSCPVSRVRRTETQRTWSYFS